MWWSPDLLENGQFFKSIYKPVLGSTLCSVGWSILYFYTNIHMGVNFHTHLGILVGFIIGVRYSFGMMRMNQVLKSLSVLNKLIIFYRLHLEILLWSEKTLVHSIKMNHDHYLYQFQQN